RQEPRIGGRAQCDEATRRVADVTAIERLEQGIDHVADGEGARGPEMEVELRLLVRARALQRIVHLAPFDDAPDPFFESCEERLDLRQRGARFPRRRSAPFDLPEEYVPLELRVELSRLRVDGSARAAPCQLR